MTGEPTDSQVADGLLAHLRTELGRPDLAYAEPSARVAGGFDTMTYGFRLQGAAGGWSGPLILRLFRRHDDPNRARWESTVHTTLARLDYPAPKVLLTSTGTEALGGAFIVMERAPGTMMLAGVFQPSRLLFLLPRILVEVPRLLAETQARLHALDAAALLTALEDEGLPPDGAGPAGISRRVATVKGQLGRAQRRIEDAQLDGLKPGLEWLLAHRPPEPDRRVICHGDFHPLNILMEDGAVTGVVDWANTVVADPAFDVGNTRLLLEIAPLELPLVLEWVASAARPILARRYYEAYRRHRAVNEEAMRYYQAMRCVTELVWVGERRLADAGLIETRSGPNPWGAARPRNALMSRFREITGIALTLPAAP